MNPIDWMACLQSRGVRTFILKDLFDLAGSLRKAAEKRGLHALIADPALLPCLQELGIPIHPGTTEEKSPADSAVVLEVDLPGPDGALAVEERWPGRIAAARAAGALFLVVPLDRGFPPRQTDPGILPWPDPDEARRMRVAFL